MNDQDRELAEYLADAIMSAPSMGRATRIAFKQGATVPDERDLGGFSRDALADHIDGALADRRARGKRGEQE